MCRRRKSVSHWSLRPVSSAPPTRIVPDVGRSRPLSRWSSVDLPETGGPHQRHNLALFQREGNVFQNGVLPGAVSIVFYKMGNGDKLHRICRFHAIPPLSA